MDLTALAITFGTIFLVELPDKTFIAALVLSTRYQPLAVWVGVGTAFCVQTVVAVTVGAVVTHLVPEEIVKLVTLCIFVIGAVVLWRTAPGAEAETQEQQEEFAEVASTDRSWVKAAGASFLVLFAAEWGDLSQILTVNMVARFHDHVSVFIGAWVALLTVSGLAVLVGRVLLRYLKLSLLHYFGAAVCLVLAAWTLFEVLS